MDGTSVALSPIGGTQQKIDPIFISAQAAADALGLCRRQVYRRMDDGLIEDAYEGRKRLAVVESVRAYAEQMREEARKRRNAPSDPPGPGGELVGGRGAEEARKRRNAPADA